MRIFNRAHVPWFIFVIAATAVSGWLYLGNFAPRSLPPGLGLPGALVQSPTGHHHAGGTPLGLIFGSIAFAIFLFAALFGVRKKLLRWQIGSVQSWMRAHIWLTLLTVPLVLLHAGFRVGGPMTILLLWLYAIVMISGIYGLVLQHRIPRLMQERVPTETVFEQIPHVRARLCAAAEELRESFDVPGTGRVLTAAAARTTDTMGLVKTREDGIPNPVTTAVTATVSTELTSPAPDRESELAMADFLDRQVLPYLRSRRARDFGLGNVQASEDIFRFVRLNVTSAYRPLVEEVHAWCEERRLLEVQTKLHRWLHAWLFVHVPFSFLLVILTGWHAFVTLFYY